MSKYYRSRNKPKNPNWRQDNISPAQIWKLKNLGYPEHELLGLTKGLASDMITAEVFGNRPQYEDVPPPMCSGDHLTQDDPFYHCTPLCDHCYHDPVIHPSTAKRSSA